MASNIFPISSPSMAMASSPTLSLLPSSSFSIFCKTHRSLFSPTAFSVKPISVKALSSSVNTPTAPAAHPLSTQLKTSNWQWKFKGNSINIYYEEHKRESPDPPKNIILIPTISDVSTVEEWRSVAKDIVQRAGDVNWRAVIVDWPGLGFSDRPKMDYNADIMEKFLVDFMNAPDGPLGSENESVVIGGGHAATIAVSAAKKGLVKPMAIAAVAPTWAGPLPIVFGRDSNMETRYGLLRGTLRAPAVGWMMYSMLVSNEKAIESQYKSHVYSNPDNVTPEFVQSRYALTKQKGARYVPAAFLTGLLDPVKSREDFLELFAEMEGKTPVLVVSSKGSPKRSKAEMEALRGAKGVTKFVEVAGALLPQEEYPAAVAHELYQFLLDMFHSKASSS